jgi:hypothetical protein
MKRQKSRRHKRHHPNPVWERRQYFRERENGMSIAERLTNAEAKLQQHIQMVQHHKEQAEAHNAEGLRWEGRVLELRELVNEAQQDAQTAADATPESTEAEVQPALHVVEGEAAAPAEPVDSDARTVAGVPVEDAQEAIPTA